MKLNAIYKINELGMVVIHDMNGQALLYMAYQNRNKAEEIIKRVNEYEKLQKENDQLIEEIINLRNDLDNQIALNRELTKALELAIKRAECPLEDFTFKTEFCAENCNANKPDIECWLQLAKYELEKAEGVE